MSKWRELKYYTHGTPTKTRYADRRRHLFQLNLPCGDFYTSPCGLHVTAVRFNRETTDVQKCKHCLKHVKVTQ